MEDLRNILTSEELELVQKVLKAPCKIGFSDESKRLEELGILVAMTPSDFSLVGGTLVASCYVRSDLFLESRDEWLSRNNVAIGYPAMKSNTGSTVS
jgi:hypothetical protein